MSIENALISLRKAESVLWETHAPQNTPANVAEAGRLVEIAISCVSTQQILEQALAELNKPSEFHMVEVVAAAKDHVRKAIYCLENQQSSRHFEWQTRQGLGTDS